MLSCAVVFVAVSLQSPSLYSFLVSSGSTAHLYSYFFFPLDTIFSYDPDSAELRTCLGAAQAPHSGQSLLLEFLINTPQGFSKGR